MRIPKPAFASFAAAALAATALAADPAGAEREPGEPPTWSGEIARLLHEHCVSCHRPDGAGPFSLIGADAARKRARQIAGVVSSRYMPPWLPVDGHGEFRDARRLDAADIDAIVAWAGAGAPIGDPESAPAPPEFSSSWTLGPPDLVLEPKPVFTLPADGTDVYRNFVLTPGLPSRRWVRAIEFRPHDRRLVHHARIAVDPTPASRRAAAADPVPGFDGMDLGAAENPDGHLLGWAPGRVARPFGDGMAWALDPEDDLVAQLHLVPSGKSEPVRFRLGLYFTDDPPVRRPVTVVLGSREIDIPPGEAAYEVRDAYVLPVDARATAVVPHAHYLGKTMELTAYPPDGGERSLLRIDDWDFNWQDEYHYAEPVRLTAGTRIEMRYTYDNSAENPRNPHVPPKRVTQGPRTVDEMAELALQWLPDDPDDVEWMERDARRQRAAEAIRFRTKRLEENPDDVESLSALGSSWLEVEEPERAIGPLTKAARLRPDDAKLLNNLGYALERTGRVAKAIERFRHALALDDGLIEARRNLARALRARGEWREAARHLSRLLDAAPEDAAAAIDLAWILATHPDGEVRDPLRAKTLAGRVVARASEPDPVALATLAAALAATGETEGAVRRADEALASARARGLAAFESALQRQMDQYRAGRPWIQRGVR